MDDPAVASEIQELMRQHRIGSKDRPNGKEFSHPIWGRKQVVAWCTNCDLLELRTWIANNICRPQRATIA